MRSADGENKKPPARITVAVESKILASREEAAQMLSISQRALDYLIATRRLPTRRIGGRVLIPSPSFGKMRGPTIQSGSWLRSFWNGRNRVRFRVS
jgi:hypothetical protein